ncbi:MAG: MetQ/NlpA family ABC transporter substrate-binding protein [Eubacteriales bacterium]|nr:MetQ/NlpA family ABC transporter substrate-binding protein [Eubacteriales bacterium]MDD3199407.1 MetQ/NlpA family ABC transporter substrate-binding protein [Eubacteriales bacterium]MDD4121979.1 MetQ/NlpA family ABC transporter substrate-binding protein [Eubacteriales bacterium]MDD4629925.1 MetQ/NlpA family ABC transporter substrate-binding protein [Eubacteriales bacterium]
MKKKLALILILAVAVFAFAACGGNGDTEQGDTDAVVLKIGASTVPHAEILEFVKPMLAEEGIDLQIIEYTDYVIPNTAVDSHELDANYFQHLPYLISFNESNGTNLVSAVAVHYEPMGIFAGKTATLEELAAGATIAVPNDPTNEARALLLLEQEGLIKIKDGVGLEATPNDIVDNPMNIKFFEAEAAAVARAVQDVDFAIINGNYALEAGFKVSDALAVESAESEAAKTFANIVAVYEGDEEKPEIQALVNALTSDETKAFIEENYQGAVVPVF